MRIYFAGPLFTPYERSFIDQCAAQLRSEGFEVFVPHEIPLPDPVTAKFIFEVDSKEVMSANAVLALLDGPMVDDGTATEIGIFWAAMRSDKSKKGIVGLVTDTRVIRGELQRKHLQLQRHRRYLGGLVRHCAECAANHLHRLS